MDKTMDDEELRRKLVRLGKLVENRGVENDLTRTETRKISKILRRKGANETFRQQVIYDLTEPEFKVFDWLAMCLDGRWTGYGETSEEEENVKRIVREWSEIYLEKKDLGKFLEVVFEKY